RGQVRRLRRCPLPRRARGRGAAGGVLGGAAGSPRAASARRLSMGPRGRRIPLQSPLTWSQRMSQLDFVVAVPARYAATRLPGKPLRPLGSEPLVLHVARRALAAGAREVWLATDDGRVAAAVADVPGVRVAMTSPDHASGTDR